MTTDGSNYYVIGGGPGSGKTTIIEGLRSRGFRCVEEVGRAIIRNQVKIGGDALHWADQAKFAELMLSHSMQDYVAALGGSDPVLFDHGIPEFLGYWKLVGKPTPKHFENAIRLFRYNRRVFVTPPWPEIYRNDAERQQDLAEAIATYDAVTASCSAAGYELVEVPRGSVEERVAFILRRVMRPGSGLGAVI